MAQTEVQKPAPEGYHYHKNGGGLVQDTATVSESAYVGPNAWVYGDALVVEGDYSTGKVA